MPFFSVVIPSYNRADLIGRTLDSALAQDFKDYEVIVVDDGSTDDTLRVVAEYETRHRGQIKVFRQQNAGPGEARNTGVRRAGGQYIAFLDSDDVWFPWTLSGYKHAIATLGDPAGLFGATVRFEADGALKSRRPSPPVVVRFEDFLDTVDTPDVERGTCSLALRADVLRESGGFFHYPIYCEDLDLLLRLGTTGPFALVREPLMVARRSHGGSTVGNIGRTYAGTMYLIDQEKSGRYPGGHARAPQRRSMICHHVRFICAAFLAQGHARRAFRLWARTLTWQLKLRRWKFAVGLPITSVVPRLNPVRPHRSPSGQG